jgi:hypothetical protein
MPRVKRVLPVAALMLTAALMSGLVGFVYAHEPTRDEQVVRLRPQADTLRIVSGTVTRIGDGRITIEGDGGAIDLALPAGVAMEELQAGAQSALVTGAQVNIGVERSEFGFALTGVVVVAGP